MAPFWKGAAVAEEREWQKGKHETVESAPSNSSRHVIIHNSFITHTDTDTPTQKHTLYIYIPVPV